MFRTIYKQPQNQIDALDLSPTLIPRKRKMPRWYSTDDHTDTAQCEFNTVEDLYYTQYFKALKEAVNSLKF